MTRRLVEEDTEAPMRALRIYAASVLFSTLVIRFLIQRPGFSESIGLCILAQVLVVYCHFYVASEHEHTRRMFRVYLSLVTGMGCAVLLSHGGLRARLFDPLNAVVFGVAGAVATHAAGLVIAAVADRVLDRMRRFVGAHECRSCGYDLTGNVSGMCPECGTTVVTSQRSWLRKVGRA